MKCPADRVDRAGPALPVVQWCRSNLEEIDIASSLGNRSQSSATGFGG